MKFATWKSLLSVVLVSSISHAGDGASTDWAQFRGGVAMSVASSELPTPWKDPTTAWRTPIPGSGWSQPIVVGNHVYVTTAVSAKADKPKGMMGGVIDPSTMGKAPTPKDPYQFKLLAIKLETGEIEWEATVAEAIPPFGKHASNTFATETPAANSTAIFTLFGSAGVLASVDHQGKKLWSRSLEAQKIQNDFGTGASLLLHDNKLYAQLYNESFAKLYCVDTQTGNDVWSVERPKGSSWATPIVWINQGQAEIVTAGQGSVIAYDAATGTEKWKYAGLDTSFSCSLVADSSALYVGTSSPGSKAPIAAIASGKSGDLTLQKGEAKSDAVLWSGTKSGAGMPSPVVVQDKLYYFGNTATCYDKATGKEVYRKRIPGGTLAAGCPIVVGDRIIVINEAGKGFVIQAGDNMEVLSEFTIAAKDEVFWSTPALVDGRLLVRSSDAIYCLK